MGTWFCQGSPTWNCEDLGRDGGWNSKSECCGYCNNCKPAGGLPQTWQCNSTTNVCTFETGYGGFSTKDLCDKACSGGSIDTWCSAGYSIFGYCVSKSSLFIVGGAILLLTMMKKKKY